MKYGVKEAMDKQWRIVLPREWRKEVKTRFIDSNVIIYALLETSRDWEWSAKN